MFNIVNNQFRKFYEFAQARKLEGQVGRQKYRHRQAWR